MGQLNFYGVVIAINSYCPKHTFFGSQGNPFLVGFNIFALILFRSPCWLIGHFFNSLPYAFTVLGFGDFYVFFFLSSYV
jgi:hypothetical protein